MGTGAPVKSLLARVVTALDNATVPYMVTGSLASSFHGEPRSTHDIDLVIDPNIEGLERFFTEFPSDAYYLSPDAARSAFETRGQFNVVDFETGWKADFIVRKDRPFSRKEFDRREQVVLFELPLWIASPEDVIIAKLEWARISESERQLRDVAGIVSVRAREIDRDYIERWVEELSLSVEWERVKIDLDRA